MELKLTNSIFRGGRYSHLNACMNWKYDSSDLYYNGYWEGATRLVNELKQNNKGIDLLVYPIVFLYRQYFELRLKYIIRDSRVLLGEEGTFPPNHNILSLWCVVNGNLLKITKSIDPDLSSHITKKDLKLVKTIIGDFAEVDPKSMAFRYPKSTTGDSHLNGLTYINMECLEIKMKELKVMLDKFDMAIESLID